MSDNLGQMKNDKGETEVALSEFFAGLSAGLNSLREVRSVYDEQVAFEFNSTNFFSPNETKTSEILAFFLNPNANHGQKGTFLKLFIRQFGIRILPASLMDDFESIKVICEDATAENRRIDIAVQFSDNEYIIGIENKIGTAGDQPKQIEDYVEDLRRRTKGDDKKWTLFYLTPNGDNPSPDSIAGELRDELLNNENKNLRLINYREQIIGLFGQFELACKAESVRAFLKDFGQYLKQIHIGKSFMGENSFVTDYLRNHPDILEHADALQYAVISLKCEFFNAFWSKVAEHLKAQDIDVDIAKMNWNPSNRYSSSNIEHSGSFMFGDQSELKRATVFYEPKDPGPFQVYTAINLGISRNKLSLEMKSNVEQMEQFLKNSFTEVRFEEWWCAKVAIPHPDFNNGEAICEFLKDKGGNKMQCSATVAAEKISQYIKLAEASWSEISLQKSNVIKP